MLSELTLKDDCLSVVISGGGAADLIISGCAIMRVIQSASTADRISVSSSPARLMLISSLSRQYLRMMVWRCRSNGQAAA